MCMRRKRRKRNEKGRVKEQGTKKRCVCTEETIVEQKVRKCMCVCVCGHRARRRRKRQREKKRWMYVCVCVCVCVDRTKRGLGKSVQRERESVTKRTNRVCVYTARGFAGLTYGYNCFLGCLEGDERPHARAVKRDPLVVAPEREAAAQL